MKQFLDYMDILITAPCYLGYLCMADKFCRKYLGASKQNEILFVVFSFGGWLFLNIMDKIYPKPYIFYAMLDHIVFMGLVLLLFQAGWKKKILAASMLVIVMTAARNFFGSLLSCAALFLKHIIKNVPEPFLGGLESYLIECAGICLALAAVWWMSGHLTSVFSGKPEKWYAMLAAPLLMIIAVFDAAVWGACHGVMFRSGGNMGLYYDQIFSHMGFCILAALSISAAGVYVFGMNRIYLEQEKSNKYHSQIDVYKMLTEQYSQSERLRHDMKNHIIALSGLFQNKEWEKMGDYLKNMEGSVLEIGADVTGSKTLDALLYQKRKRAERESVRWECDIRMPKACLINEFDICILFGNILDNALEACERIKRMGRKRLKSGECYSIKSGECHGLKSGECCSIKRGECNRIKCEECCFVSIKARKVRKCFFIEVKNSMAAAEKYTEGFTHKENVGEHGIGLLNVRDVVQRYNGAVNIETQNGIFVISILIPLSDDGHDIKQAV